MSPGAVVTIVRRSRPVELLTTHEPQCDRHSRPEGAFRSRTDRTRNHRFVQTLPALIPVGPVGCRGTPSGARAARAEDPTLTTARPQAPRSPASGQAAFNGDTGADLSTGDTSLGAELNRTFLVPADLNPDESLVAEALAGAASAPRRKQWRGRGPPLKGKCSVCSLACCRCKADVFARPGSPRRRRQLVRNLTGLNSWPTNRDAPCAVSPRP